MTAAWSLDVASVLIGAILGACLLLVAYTLARTR